MSEAFGEEVRRRRTKLGMSQQQLADLARVSRGTIRNIENGRETTRLTARSVRLALKRTEGEDFVTPTSVASTRGEVRWEDPPPARGTRQARSRWHRIAAELRANPGQWAVVATYPSMSARSTAVKINAGKVAAMRPAGHWEACTRTVEGETRIYARYVGGGSGE